MMTNTCLKYGTVDDEAEGAGTDGGWLDDAASAGAAFNAKATRAVVNAALATGSTRAGMNDPSYII
jgi:hypothetical protein